MSRALNTSSADLYCPDVPEARNSSASRSAACDSVLGWGVGKVEWNALFADDLSVEGAGNGGKVEPEVLGDSGCLIFCFLVHSNGDGRHGAPAYQSKTNVVQLHAIALRWCGQ